MLRLFVAAALSVALLVPTVALAAPITCPPGQEVVKDSPGVWHCGNNGDSGNPNTEDTKNPNDKILADYASDPVDGILAAVVKVGVCHRSEDDDRYVYLEVPA